VLTQNLQNSASNAYMANLFSYTLNVVAAPAGGNQTD